MATAPTQMSREMAMELLTNAGTYLPDALAAFANMDDSVFNLVALPAAQMLMKKTRKPAAKAMSEEEKAQKIKDMKMAWLKECCAGDVTQHTLIEEMGIAPPAPNIVFYTKEEKTAMSSKERRDATKYFLNTTKLINQEETNMDEYMKYVADYEMLVCQIQKASYKSFKDVYGKKKFSIGNIKINAAGNIVKAGGKSEVSENELAGEVIIDGKKYDLQKNTEEAEKGHPLNVPEGVFRLKKCGADSKQVAILPYTTPYHPTSNCGCSAPVMIKDITDFMVKINDSGSYTKIGMEDAVKCAPCFRRCNADTTKGADGLCARHYKVADKEYSARMIKVADISGFSLGDRWRQENTEWYDNY